MVAPHGASIRLRTPVELFAPRLLGEPVDPELSTLAAGEELAIELAAGEVLQLESTGAALTGASLEADLPVLVVVGSGCANVPSRFGACDHLEEVVPPLEAWGRELVISAPRMVDGEPSIVRVISSTDDNELRFDGRAPLTLDRGEVYEELVDDDVVVGASAPVMVTQYLVGAQYFDRGASHSSPGPLGDPSMGIVAPIEQRRASFSFVVPESFDATRLALVAPQGTTLTLDGVALAPAEEHTLEGGFVVVRQPITGGAHQLRASAPVSLTIYGHAPFTSYLLPGGLVVEELE